MHDTAMEIGRLVMDRYSVLSRAKILELGSYDINGSLRNNAPATAEYVGLDLEAGPGVDFVVEAGKPWPVKDNYFDLVLASSVFEHDPMFWVTFLQMIRKARDGGYIYISAPSNGSVHRHPQDNWRFYPDSGVALARWAKAQGEQVTLIESFTAGRKGDQWNDYVAVFRKGEDTSDLPKHFVYKQFTSFNILTWETEDLINPQAMTEDMAIIERTQTKVRELEETVGRISFENQLNWDERQKAQRALLTTEARLLQEEAGHEKSRTQVQSLSASLERQRANIELAESKIREYRLLAESHEAARHDLARQLDEKAQAADIALAQLAEGQVRLEELQAGNNAHLSELETLRAALEDAAGLRDQLAVAESTLLQRQEEIEQTDAELRTLRSLHEALLGERDSLAARVEEAESWVLKLAAERRQWERDAQRSAKLLAKAELQARTDATELNVKLHKLEIERDQLRADAEAAAEALAAARAEAAADKLTAARNEVVAAERQSPPETDSAKYEQIVAEANERAAAAERERETCQIEVAKISHAAGERLSEIVTLTRILESNQREMKTAQTNMDWLRDINQTLQSSPRWWSFLPRKKKRKRELERLNRKGLFDAGGYLARYPDVAEAGMDPLDHYIIHGIAEGRLI